MFKVYPINNGNHNNIHYIAKDNKGIVSFKIVCFLDTEEAYIVKPTMKINTKLLDVNTIYDNLLDKLETKGFKLKTPKEDIFKIFQNTSEIIVHYNLFLNES